MRFAQRQGMEMGFNNMLHILSAIGFIPSICNDAVTTACVLHIMYILKQKNAVCVFHWMEEYTTSPFAASPCLAKREPRDLQNYCSEQGACQPVSFEQWEEALTSLCKSVFENTVVSI